MKNKFKLLEAMRSIAIIAIAAIIGFSFIACDEKTDDNETTAATASFAGTWKASGERSIVFTGNTFNYKVNNVTKYSGTFSASGTTITFDESSLGQANGNFALTATTLTLSNHTWDSSVNGTYTKEGGNSNPPVFTLNNISTAQQTEGSTFFVFGLFPTGTTKANVETDANLARTQSAYPSYVVAYAGGTSGSLPFQGLGTNSASISSTLKTSTGTTWNSTGTYDGWVCLYNGTTWTSYKSNSAITVSGNVTKNAQTDFTKQDGSGNNSGNLSAGWFEVIGSPATAYRVVRHATETPPNDVIIPATYNGLPVTEIGRSSDSSSDAVFYNRQNITSVTIADSVKSIHSNSFNSCLNLTSITLSSNLITIGDSAFESCYNLADVIIPDSVTTISSFSFSFCSALTNIIIPVNVLTIGMSAFSHCTSLVSVTFEGNITSANFAENTFHYSGVSSDLKGKYLAGGIGTYTRPNGTSMTWTKQDSGDVITEDVYIAGEDYNNTAYYNVAAIWKNNSVQILSDTCSSAASVYVSGSDVYVAGTVDTIVNARATLWKNNTPQTLSGGARSFARSVYVSGSDVYVAGEVSEGGVGSLSFRATVWKNGERQTLSSTSSYAYSVFVSGSDVYVAGYTNEPRATLWKNGVAQTLSTVDSAAFSVYVYGSDVYVSGVVGDVENIQEQKATLWKNGIAQTLNDRYSIAYSVYVNGTDVYVAGGSRNDSYENLLFTSLWKNGVVQNLTSPVSDAAASFFLSGADEYVAGGSRYWKNGTRQNLNSNYGSTSNIKALSIFVVPRN